MIPLSKQNVRLSYPGAVMTPAFGALAPTANANKQPPSASEAWLGARTPIFGTQACAARLMSDGVDVLPSRTSLMSHAV